MSGHRDKYERNEQIRHQYQLGISIRKLAKLYGLSRQRIHSICGPVDKMQRFRHFQNLILQGSNVWEIANETGLPPANVHNILYSNGEM